MQFYGSSVAFHGFLPHFSATAPLRLTGDAGEPPLRAEGSLGTAAVRSPTSSGELRPLNFDGLGTAEGRLAAKRFFEKSQVFFLTNSTTCCMFLSIDLLSLVKRSQVQMPEKKKTTKKKGSPKPPPKPVPLRRKAPNRMPNYRG